MKGHGLYVTFDVLVLAPGIFQWTSFSLLFFPVKKTSTSAAIRYCTTSVGFPLRPLLDTLQ